MKKIKKFILALIALLIPTMMVHPEVEETSEVYPIVVLGSGVGALTSAVYLARGGITPIVIEGKQLGGALAQSHSVQNWPGELDISGGDLIEKIHQQALANGAQFRSEEVISVDFTKRPFTITTRDKTNNDKVRQVKTHACIIAMGTSSNYLNIPGEQQYFTKGVYTCAVCDGSLFKDKTVAIVGGGDAAVTEGHYLANIAKKVHIFVRKDAFRTTDEKMKEQLLSHPNVEVHYNTSVKEVQGDGKKATQLIVMTKNQEKTVPIDGMFLAIGASPNTDMFKGQLQLDNQGYILIKNERETSIEGVFAIGDITRGICKQAVCAAGEAAASTIQAQKYLSAFTLNKIASKQPSAPIAPPKEKVAPSKIREITSVKEIRTKEEFRELIQNSKMPVMVDFYATWCGPCKTLGPIFESWSKVYAGQATFVKVNIDKLPELAQEFHVESMPTVVFFKDKKEVDRKIGTTEIPKLISQLEKKQPVKK